MILLASIDNSICGAETAAPHFNTFKLNFPPEKLPLRHSK